MILDISCNSYDDSSEIIFINNSYLIWENGIFITNCQFTPIFRINLT